MQDFKPSTFQSLNKPRHPIVDQHKRKVGMAIKQHGANAHTCGRLYKLWVVLVEVVIITATLVGIYVGPQVGADSLSGSAG